MQTEVFGKILTRKLINLSTGQWKTKLHKTSEGQGIVKDPMM